MELVKMGMQLYDRKICLIIRDIEMDGQVFGVCSTVPLTWIFGDIAKLIQALFLI